MKITQLIYPLAIAVSFTCCICNGIAYQPTTIEEQRPQQTQDNLPPDSEIGSLSADEIRELHAQAVQLHSEEKFSEALDVLRKILLSQPGDLVALYNAACVQARLGHNEESIKLLIFAVSNGFIEFEDVAHDSDLDTIRDLPGYEAIFSMKDELIAKAGERLYHYAGRLLGDRAVIVKDDETKLIFATELPDEARLAMMQTITVQFEYQSNKLFKHNLNSYVLLLVPSPNTADRIIGSSRIGGYYDHDSRQLVTRDLGPSLQHEITHALHHAHMDSLDQKHPMWIQEGLSALFEMYEFDASGQFMPLDNTRINVAINLKRVGGLSRWKKLFNESDRKYTSSRPLAKYAESRAIFQYIAEKYSIEEWYATYIESYEEDSTGLLACEKIFGKKIKEIERDFRLWVGNHDKMPVKIRKTEPSLGLWIVDQGANDGVEIVGVNPRGSAKQTTIRARDVITAVNGKPVYAVEEILLLISRMNQGDNVALRYRRGSQYHDVTIELQPVPPSRTLETIQEPGTPV